LRDVYGESLEVEPPRVRLIEGVQVQEPVMHARVSLPTQFLAPVKRALQRRGAALCEEYVRGRWSVLRSEAPLAALLGLSEELARLTDGTARQWVVLSHYALVTGGPGGAAA
jgi:translation elongation factor EF-G